MAIYASLTRMVCAPLGFPHRERRHISCFPGFQFPTQAYGKMRFPQDFEQVFRGASEPLPLLQVHPVIAAVLRLRQLQRKQQGVSVVIAARHAGFCHAEALHYRLRAPVVGIGHGNYLPQFGHACA